jgi:hypothetical protein
MFKEQIERKMDGMESKKTADNVIAGALVTSLITETAKVGLELTAVMPHVHHEIPVQPQSAGGYASVMMAYTTSGSGGLFRIGASDADLRRDR